MSDNQMAREEFLRHMYTRLTQPLIKGVKWTSPLRLLLGLGAVIFIIVYRKDLAALFSFGASFFPSLIFLILAFVPVYLAALYITKLGYYLIEKVAGGVSQQALKRHKKFVRILYFVAVLTFILWSVRDLLLFLQEGLTDSSFIGIPSLFVLYILYRGVSDMIKEKIRLAASPDILTYP